MNGFISFIGVTLVSLLFLTTTSDASTVETKQTESSASELIFEAGGVLLEQQNLPTFLYPYHSKSLDLTEAAFADPSLNCTRGISYGEESHQLLDVWTASENESNDSKRPIVIFIHGGGWDWGYREWVGFCARNICREGAIMVAPSYKLGKGTEQAWPQAKHDILSVLQWVTENADEYGGDASKIILAGHSAGGHLAASVLSDPDMLESSGIIKSDKNPIKAVFLISCPLGVRADDLFMTMQNKWWWRLLLGRPAKFLFHRVKPGFLRPLVGKGSRTKYFKETLVDASPLAMESVDEARAFPKYVHVTHAAKKDFPFVRMHGLELEKKLGQNVEVLELPVEGHFETHFSLEDKSGQWYDAFRRVMSKL